MANPFALMERLARGILQRENKNGSEKCQSIIAHCPAATAESIAPVMSKLWKEILNYVDFCEIGPASTVLPLDLLKRPISY